MCKACFFFYDMLRTFQMEIVRHLMLIIMRFKTINSIITYLLKPDIPAYNYYFI